MSWLEAKLIIPSQPPTGSWRETYDETRIRQTEYRNRVAAIERQIVKAFGGFTVVEGRGYWLDDGARAKEPVRVYTIAYDPSPTHCEEMDRIGDAVKEQLDQEAVYLSHTVLTGLPIT